jgi:hypothetical protein
MSLSLSLLSPVRLDYSLGSPRLSPSPPQTE